jgi:hypothetical protein
VLGPPILDLSLGVYDRFFDLLALSELGNRWDF